MSNSLAPILVRANVPNRMRELRLAIEELEAIWEHYPNQATEAHAVRLQQLKAKLKQLQKEYIFVVVDNSCTQ